MTRWRPITLLAVSTATAMLLLDVTVVYVALPAIGRDIHVGFDGLQWVVDAYALTLAATLLTAGVLADRLGRRMVFAGGLVVFTVCSALCGAASSGLLLNLARAAQGIGAAAMFASSLALLAHEFQGVERGFALGVWGAITGAVLAIGPLVGGVIVDGLGWRWIFFLNLPIGALLVWLTLHFVPESRDDQWRPLDLAGLTSFGAACFLATYARSGLKKRQVVARPRRALPSLGAVRPLSDGHSERIQGLRRRLCETASRPSERRAIDT